MASLSCQLKSGDFKGSEQDYTGVDFYAAGNCRLYVFDFKKMLLYHYCEF